MLDNKTVLDRWEDESLTEIERLKANEGVPVKGIYFGLEIRVNADAEVFGGGIRDPQIRSLDFEVRRPLDQRSIETPELIKEWLLKSFEEQFEVAVLEHWEEDESDRERAQLRREDRCVTCKRSQ